MNNIKTGVLLIEILMAITLGMFIYDSAQAQVDDALKDMSSRQIEAFNSNFSSYEAEQIGSQVKSLLGRLIANANTYETEPSKVPTVIIADQVADDYDEYKNNNSISYTESNAQANGNYIINLATIRNHISIKHMYYVEFGYSEDGLIDSVIIYYDTDTMKN